MIFSFIYRKFGKGICLRSENFFSFIINDRLKSLAQSGQIYDRQEAKQYPFTGYVALRTVPTIVTAHTFCASRDTRVSYG